MNQNQLSTSLNKQIQNKSAFLIQSMWRSHLSRIKKKKTTNNVTLIYTPLSGQSYKIKQNTFNMEHLLYLKQIEYEKLDLTEHRYLQQKAMKIKDQGFELPFLFIDDIFLGSYENIQILEDNGYLDDILNQSFNKRCLICNLDRIDPIKVKCDDCGTLFNFFKQL